MHITFHTSFPDLFNILKPNLFSFLKDSIIPISNELQLNQISFLSFTESKKMLQNLFRGNKFPTTNTGKQLHLDNGAIVPKQYEFSFPNFQSNQLQHHIRLLRKRL